MRKEKAKRIGRPMKAPTRGERVSLGLKVTAETKRRIDSAARATGLTQSQEAERRIELSYHYERVLKSLDEASALIAELNRGNAEKALDRLGWGKVLDPRYGGFVYVPPGRDFPMPGFPDPREIAQAVVAALAKTEGAP
jgi:hypothetical protein